MARISEKKCGCRKVAKMKEDAYLEEVRLTLQSMLELADAGKVNEMGRNRARVTFLVQPSTKTRADLIAHAMAEDPELRKLGVRSVDIIACENGTVQVNIDRPSVNDPCGC